MQRQGDIIMCAMLALVIPQELKITKTRISRFIEAYIGLYMSSTLTCAVGLTGYTQMF